jgi:hypothetical protein
MPEPFDAGRIHADPPDPETLAAQDRELESLEARPIGLSNAKLHAERDLEGYTAICNRIAWGDMPSEMRAPAPDEVTALLESLSEDDREKLLDQARLASAQRHWLARLEEAEQQHLAQARADEEQRARAEAEAREWAEFEAYDAAGKQERFKQWRAAKHGGS